MVSEGKSHSKIKAKENTMSKESERTDYPKKG